MKIVSVRILIADDFEAWRLQVRTLLRPQKEWEIVSEAKDGLEAVQNASEFHPDVVLMDIGMPVLNGMAAAAQIRQLSPNSKIIFLTVNSSPEVINIALNTVAAGYVLKAKARRELIPAIEEVVKGQPVSPP